MKWWIHKKWLEELYDLRSKVVHKGQHETKKWGWKLDQHLVLAALVFRLAVKLMLERDGHYILSDSDKIRCLAVDKLLGAIAWDQADEEERTTRWDSIMSKIRSDYSFDRAMEKIQRERPDWFGGE